MSLLNFEPSNPLRKGSKKPFKLILGIGALVGTIALGSTLAASINLNSSGPVEFGQGVTQTTACDSQVEVTPISSFVNSDGGGDFKFSAITLSDLDGTDQSESSEGCAGKTFTIKAYDAYGAQLQPSYEISVDSDGYFSSPSGEGNATDEGTTDSSVTLTFFGGILTSAESVYRITIESSGESASELDDGNYLFVSSDRAPFEIVRANTNGANLVTDFTDNDAYSSMLTTDANYLYWNDGRDIYKSPFANPSTRTLLLTINGSCWLDFPTGLAVDSTYIYYANGCTSSIGRAKLDGSERDDGFIVETNGSGWFENPGYIDNDIYGLYVSNDKIYWANYTTNTIGRANIDGSNQNSDFINLKPGSFTGSDSSIGGITGVTVQGNYIYWANWDINTIGRASVDGSGIDNTFISTGASTNPYNITSSSSKLYWTNYGSGSVAKSNLDGTGKSVLFSYPFAIGIALYQNVN